MRFAQTFFAPSRQYAAAPTGPTKDPRRGEAGSDGIDWYSDMLGGGPDVNPELTGAGKHQVYEEMAKTDASVKSMLFLLGLPVRSAEWGLNPRTEDPLDKLIRDYVAWNLGLEEFDGELDLSWDELLQQGLRMLQYGAMFEELVWDDSLVVWRDADGDAHLTRPLRRLAPRFPSTIEKVDRRNGRIVSIKQNIPGTKPIPGDKLSYLVFEREGNRWDGVSVLRPAWGPWRLKKALMIAAGIGWDRFASGLPVVWHPDTPEGNTKARAIGRNVRQHERGYVHFPVPQGGTREDSEWALELLNGAATLADPVPLLRFFSEQIAEAGFQQAMRQGLGQTGARATAEVQIDPYFLAVQTVAGYMRRERARQVIRELVRVNFGQEAADRRTPILTVSKIQVRSLETIARAAEMFATAGFQLVGRHSNRDVRDLLGFAHDEDLAEQGITRARLLEILRGLRLDADTFAGIVNALPPELGLARNIDEGLGLAA